MEVASNGRDGDGESLSLISDSDDLEPSDDDFGTSSDVATIPVEPETPERVDFMSLPTEILLEIFSYMDFGDLLELRSTCATWNNVISSWSRFTNNTSFNVIRGEFPYNESLNILKASTVAWNEVILEDFADPIGPFRSYTRYLHTNLASLVLVECSFAWSWILKVTGSAELPLLHKLAIVNCKRTIERDEGWFQPKSLIDGFSDFKKRITHLKLAGDDMSNLNFYMRQFTFEKSDQDPPHPLLLEAFEISVHPKVFTGPTTSEDSDEDMPSFGVTSLQFSSTLSNLLSCCWQTLKSLKLFTCFNTTTYVYRCLVELVDKQIHLDLTTFHYQWLDSYRHAFARIFEPDEVLLAKFLSSQNNLESLALPRVGKSGRFTGTLLPNIIPPVLEELEIGIARSKLSMDLFKKSSALKAIKLTTHHFDGPFAFSAPHEGKQDFEQVKSFTLVVRGITGVRDYIIFVMESFPYLETLIVNCSGESVVQGITDANIQKIIQKLPLLKILTLSLSNLVSDFGVAGIRRSDSIKILQSRALYLEQDLEALGVCQTGVALSSLKFLREVSFTCTSCDISDVGIQYGFNFKNLRKLHIVCDYELSDWGLVQLARLNPLLDQCSVVTSSTLITPECKLLFRKLLPRVKRNLSIVSAVMQPFTDDELMFNSESSSSSIEDTF